MNSKICWFACCIDHEPWLKVANLFAFLDVLFHPLHFYPNPHPNLQNSRILPTAFASWHILWLFASARSLVLGDGRGGGCAESPRAAARRASSRGAGATSAGAAWWTWSKDAHADGFGEETGQEGQQGNLARKDDDDFCWHDTVEEMSFEERWLMWILNLPLGLLVTTFYAFFSNNESSSVLKASHRMVFLWGEDVGSLLCGGLDGLHAMVAEDSKRQNGRDHPWQLGTHGWFRKSEGGNCGLQRLWWQGAFACTSLYHWGGEDQSFFGWFGSRRWWWSVWGCVDRPGGSLEVRLVLYRKSPLLVEPNSQSWLALPLRLPGEPWKQNPGWLGYIGDEQWTTTHLYIGNYNKPW